MDAHVSGVRTNIPTKCGGETLHIGMPVVNIPGQNPVLKTARRVDMTMYQDQRNPILHDYDTHPERRQRGGPNSSAYHPWEEDYSVFKGKSWKDLTESEKKHVIQ